VQNLEARAAHARVQRAAAGWTPLGRRDDGLLSPRQLAELDGIPDLSLGVDEGDLVGVSRSALRRRSRRRWLVTVAVTLGLVLAALGLRAQSLLALRGAVDRRVADADRAGGEPAQRAPATGAGAGGRT
jgi:hypothetical protein